MRRPLYGLAADPPNAPAWRENTDDLVIRDITSDYGSVTSPILELRAVRKEFSSRRGPVVALDDIDLSIERGSIHGIVGRSGAGKSTLVRTITGLEAPTSGQVVLDGTDVTGGVRGGLRGAGLRRFRQRFGMVFQHANLLDSRTAADNIALPLEIAGWAAEERRARVAELLRLVDLEDRADNHPGQLSGGQQQRVGIARGLATRPDILICDEPTSALDSTTTRSILELLQSLRDELGITIVVITHEASVVREICDSVTLLGEGRVLESGPIAELAGDPTTAIHRDLVPLPLAPTDQLPRTLEITLGDGPDDLERALTVLRGVGTPAQVSAATIEEVGGRTVGRARLLLPEDANRAAAHRRLAEAGIAVDVGTDTPPLDVPEGPTTRPDEELSA